MVAEIHLCSCARVSPVIPHKRSGARTESLGRSFGTSHKKILFQNSKKYGFVNPAGSGTSPRRAKTNTPSHKAKTGWKERKARAYKGAAGCKSPCAKQNLKNKKIL
jgi:hypothetical protein